MRDNHLLAFGRALTLSMITSPVLAYDVNRHLSISGVLAGAAQCQDVSNAPGFRDTCTGAIPFQPELSLRPNRSNELSLKLGFASGNGLNSRSPFVLAPWAADMEDDVSNIGGRNRDHLLTAWYRHTFQSAGTQRLAATLGIIDATDYLDDNAYANDEYTQFMNAALTNGPNVFLPSYDFGAAVEWDLDHWSLRGVVMNVGENRDGNGYGFYGLQADHVVHTRFGTGQYRLVLGAGSRDFLNTDGTQMESRACIGLSFDQELGDVVGAWIRFGWQSDDAAVAYEALYSGGVDIKGGPWNRPDDNIGLGLAYLDGGNLDIDATTVAEAYYRLQLSDVLALTADVQYQSDDLKTARGPRAWTVGVRAVVGF